MGLPKTFWDNSAAASLLPPDALEVLRQIELRRHGVLPPAPLWVDANDILQLQCRNSLTGAQLQVSARLMQPDGKITTPQFTLSPTADRTINSATQALYEGYLLGASVAAIGGTVPTRGQTYSALKVNRMPAPSNLTHYLLGADYVSGTLALEWPFGRTIGAIEGPGVLRSIAGTAPAAGADVTQTVPTNARWKVRAVEATLVTSAVAGNRNPRLQVTDGVNVLYTLDVSEVVAAGTTFPLVWIMGYPISPSPSPAGSRPFPTDSPVFGGWVIRTNTTGILGGDQWSAVRFFVEEWIED